MTQPSDGNNTAKGTAEAAAWKATLREYVGADGEPDEVSYLVKKTSSADGYKSEVLGRFLTHDGEGSLEQSKQEARIAFLEAQAKDENYDLAALHTVASFHRKTQSPRKLQDLSEFAEKEWRNQTDPRRKFLLFEVYCWYLLDNWIASTDRINNLHKATEEAGQLLTYMTFSVKVPEHLRTPATHLHAILTAEWAESAELPISADKGVNGEENAEALERKAALGRNVGSALKGMEEVVGRLGKCHPRYFSTLARVQAASGHYDKALEDAALSISYLPADSSLASEFRGVQTDLKLRWMTKTQVEEVRNSASRQISKSSEDAKKQIGASSKSARRSINRTKGEFLQLLGLLAAVIAFILVGTQTALQRSDPREAIAVIGGSFGLMVLGLMAWAFTTFPGEDGEKIPTRRRNGLGVAALLALFLICGLLLFWPR